MFKAIKKISVRPVIWFCDKTLAHVYDDSLFQRKVVQPIGAIAAAYKAARGWNVEKEIDTYSNYYVTKAEGLNPACISAKQYWLLEKDNIMSDGKLYLITACTVLPEIGRVRERQIFLSSKQIKKMGFNSLPLIGTPCGNGREVLLPFSFDFKTRGQYWGSTRPRLCGFKVREGNSSDTDTIFWQAGRAERHPIPRPMSLDV